MFNKEKIKYVYNLVSEEEISESDFDIIFPKLFLITNVVYLDDVEIICVIDELRKIKKFGLLDNVTEEIIKIINKISEFDSLNMQGTVYFAELLKNIIIPYNKNIIENNYNLIMFLSEFELHLEYAKEILTKEDLVILDKYNHELKEIIVKYKEVTKLYKEKNCKDIMLSFILTHLSSMLYFNLDEYNHDYDLINDVFERIIENHQDFVNYCYSEGIDKNFNLSTFNMDNTKKEYIISNKMLEYVYNEKNKGKIKRK